MLRSWLGPLKQDAGGRAPGVTALLLLVSSLLIGGPAGRAAQPAYTLAARIHAGYRPEISVRVKGAGPFWCTLDSGAGGAFLLDKAVGEAADLHGTRRQRGFGAGPDSVVDEIVTDTALQVDKLLLPRQSIHLRSLSGEACIFGTKLIERFVVEIDYLTPEVRLFVPGGYSPAARAVKLPLMFDGSGRPMVVARLLLQPHDAAVADVLLDTAVADQVLSLSKEFSDEQKILKRVSRLISPPFKAESVGQVDLLATRIARLSFGPVGLDNPIVMLFRTATAAHGLLPDGLLGSGFLHRFLVAIDVRGASLYLTPNRTYNEPAPQWWWSAALPLLPTHQ